MPKLHSHDDTKVDAEFDNVYSKSDMYVVEVSTPKTPRTGMMWFNPDDGKLKIFKNTQSGWESVN